MFVVVCERDVSNKVRTAKQIALESYHVTYEQAQHQKKAIKERFGETTIGLVIPMEEELIQEFAEQYSDHFQELLKLFNEVKIHVK